MNWVTISFTIALGVILAAIKHWHSTRVDEATDSLFAENLEILHRLTEKIRKKSTIELRPPADFAWENEKIREIITYGFSVNDPIQQVSAYLQLRHSDVESQTLRYTLLLSGIDEPCLFDEKFREVSFVPRDAKQLSTEILSLPRKELLSNFAVPGHSRWQMDFFG
ncbi:hypothetical protein EHO57_14020 [Leptospira langatensis]|uniref:Uncharacterized protein n=1 Tax=Leptospira langatensis TaxID=2484983 RepID=A0A5R2AT96_9LEPT|nr:hypothetical protein [Leptospira langatensis]TGJ99871.1 hypothetical protein EHO57_14020 [Leptospira langatensis]